MPTYEYECTKCGKVFDLFQSITEPARKKLRAGDPKPCKCGAPVSRRISTGGGLIFKGSGFYLTDYRSESYKEAAKADSTSGETKTGDSKSSDGKSAESKVESKVTQAKAEAKPAKETKAPKADKPPKKTAKPKSER